MCVCGISLCQFSYVYVRKSRERDWNSPFFFLFSQIYLSSLCIFSHFLAKSNWRRKKKDVKQRMLSFIVDDSWCWVIFDMKLALCGTYTHSFSPERIEIYRIRRKEGKKLANVVIKWHDKGWEIHLLLSSQR